MLSENSAKTGIELSPPAPRTILIIIVTDPLGPIRELPGTNYRTARTMPPTSTPQNPDPLAHQGHAWIKVKILIANTMLSVMLQIGAYTTF